MLLPKDRSHSQNRSGWTLVSNESRAPVVQLTPGQPLYTHTRPSLGLAVVPTLRSQVPLWSSLRKLLSFWATGRPLFCAPFSVSWGFFLCRGLEILPSTACNFLWSTVPGPLAHEPQKGPQTNPQIKETDLAARDKGFHSLPPFELLGRNRFRCWPTCEAPSIPSTMTPVTLEQVPHRAGGWSLRPCILHV